ncbi:MAG: hypothetical protein HY242_03680 [Afipia sp.]|nr:hypothetical protein [Afipia sp.]
MKMISLFAAAVACFGAGASGAAAAPSQLYNKSITIIWGESGTYKRISDGVSGSRVGQFQVIVYVSSAGRAFYRYSSKSGNSGNTTDSGPENNSGIVQFNGNGFVVFRDRGGIVRRIATSFDPSFSGCTTTVTIGKIGADAKIPGFDGAGYQVIAMEPGAASCAIRDGNALGN